MKHICSVATMTKRKHFVLAGLTLVLAVTGAAPAFSGRQIHGGDVARLLTGRDFRVECIDGTQGRGQVSADGMASVSYRRPSDRREASDYAVLRVRGAEICLAWRQFGGGSGCYPVSEEAAGRYRLSTGPLWCDISPK
jgi:hypothetical protein